jgi:hypothetical protein
MPKSTFFTGQPLLTQILSLIPMWMVKKLARQHGADRYCKTFSSFDHLVTMLYAAFHQCNSIREVITGMQACASRLTHLGICSSPRRSTLSDANERRPAAFFESLYHQLYQRYYGSLPDSLKGKSVLQRLFIVDSSIISLFSTIMHSTGNYGCNGKKKGGIKAHVLVRAINNLPCFIRLTHGKEGDNKFLPFIDLPAGSIIVMDKRYRNYKQFILWTKKAITWVSRLNGRAVYRVTQNLVVDIEDQRAGVQKDQIIELGNPQTTHINSIQRARLVEFYDAVNKRTLQFITNNFKLSASTIADIYKKRWQIELVFKRIKQNFQLHYFLGDNENAIRIQVWCAFIADLLIKIIKDKADKKRKWSMSNLAGLIRLHLQTYIHLYAFLANPEKALINYQHPPPVAQMKIPFNFIRGA